MANTARYWRINHLSVGSTLGEQGQTSGSNIILADLYFYALSTDTTPLSGTYTLAPAWSAWNVIGSDATSVLTDGNITNTSVIWNENSGAGIGVTFDAGSPTTVGKVRISSIDTNQYAETPVRWVLQWSNDNVEWFDANVLTVDTTAWTQAETRDYVVSPEASYVSTERAYVVSEPPSSEVSEVSSQRAYVVSRAGEFGSLSNPSNVQAPTYEVGNGTPYIRFDPNTNDKQLWFYTETSGDYNIIALRPNLLDFFESTQTITAPGAQLQVPHFNQVFITDRTLSSAEITNIKNSMQARASGNGIDIDAGTENSVLGGLEDPYIPGVVGNAP